MRGKTCEEKGGKDYSGRVTGRGGGEGREGVMRLGKRDDIKEVKREERMQRKEEK